MKISKGWKFTLNKRISVLLFLLMFGGIYSCKKKEILSEEKPRLYIPENEFDYYFPLQTDSLDQRNFVEIQGELFPDFNVLYSSMLKNMKEPNLEKKNDSGFIIRYSAIPAFEPPYTIRIQKNFNEWFVYYKMLAFDNGDQYPYYKNDTILKDTIIPINWHQFYQLENKIKEFDITNRPTHNQIGHDGKMHILEIYENGRYDFIHRWSPREEDEKEFIELYKMIESLHPVKEIKLNSNF